MTHVAPAAAVLQGAPPSGHSGQGPGPSDSQRGPWNKDRGPAAPAGLCAQQGPPTEPRPSRVCPGDGQLVTGLWCSPATAFPRAPPVGSPAPAARGASLWARERRPPPRVGAANPGRPPADCIPLGRQEDNAHRPLNGRCRRQGPIHAGNRGHIVCRPSASVRVPGAQGPARVWRRQAPARVRRGPRVPRSSADLRLLQVRDGRSAVCAPGAPGGAGAGLPPSHRRGLGSIPIQGANQNRTETCESAGV